MNKTLCLAVLSMVVVSEAHAARPKASPVSASTAQTAVVKSEVGAAKPAPNTVESNQPLAVYPVYDVADVWVGLYQYDWPIRSKAFLDASEQLQAVFAQECSQLKPNLQALKQAWFDTLVQWQALATPAIGPVLARRSQRQIDFWPTRPRLIEKALQRAPQTLLDMELVGTPAKGFPALEWVLAQPLNANSCRYAELIAAGIHAEAQALASSDVRSLAAAEPVSASASASAASSEASAVQKTNSTELDESPGVVSDTLAQQAFEEWVNQWLGGLDRLHWQYMELPITKAKTQHEPVVFVHQSLAVNLADWKAQWRTLYAHARSKPGAQGQTPQPGKDLVPLEALLRGKGQIELANRLAASLDRVDTLLMALPPRFSEAQVLNVTRAMNELTVLFQEEVAEVLNVQLGFSDSDGD